jgi:hypothetical protein
VLRVEAKRRSASNVVRADRRVSVAPLGTPLTILSRGDTTIKASVPSCLLEQGVTSTCWSGAPIPDIREAHVKGFRYAPLGERFI